MDRNKNSPFQARFLDERDVSLLAEGATAGARLVSAIQRKDGFDVLYSILSQLCEFQNYIVYAFSQKSQPLLLHSNLGISRIQEGMADYIKGLYALDPFYELNTQGATGLFRMCDIMPDEFPKSEYYRHFYKYTDVVDELRYLVRPDSEQIIHVFVEREGEDNIFTETEVEIFHALTPFVASFVSAHMAWQDLNRQTQDTPARTFELRTKVEEMAAGVLTPRQIETVELMLKGHATKSIAHLLGIDAGTVANHKRHIYEKLDVHSQAQLFNLFLSSLV